MAKRPEITDKTKSDFRDAYWRLFCEMPLDKITVSQLCEAAGYNRGTFYLHFQDLPDLLNTIECDVMADMLHAVERCLKSLDQGKLAKAAAMGEVVAFYGANRTYINPLLGEQRDPAFVFALKEQLKPLWLAYVVPVGHGRTPAEIDLILESALTGGLSMIGRWLTNPGDVSPAQLAKLVYDVSIRDVSLRIES